MNCTECGAPTRVLETRSPEFGATVRKRLCRNGHRFETLEVAPHVVDKRELPKWVRGVQQRAERWVRNILIARDTRPKTHIAREYSLSDTQVHNIKRKVNK